LTAGPLSEKIADGTLCYNPLFASNSLSFNVLGVPRLKRTLRGLSVLILLAPVLVSCGYKGSSNNQNHSGLKFRAFVSNPLHPLSTGGGTPVLEIVDASKDVLSNFPISLAGSVSDAGIMAMSPKKDRTLVFSPGSNALALVDNATESASGSVSLPGATESFFVWTDNTTAFVAVPGAAVPGQSSGGVGRINISSGAITATIPVPGAHYLVQSPSGNQILVISDTANAVSVLFPNLIDSGTGPTAILGTFDKPVWATFSSDGTTAYVLNCGQECGGAGAASVTKIDMTQSTPLVTNSVSVPGGATVAFLQGTALYVAGTPIVPLNDCTGSGQTTSATSCGRLSVIDASSLTITSATPLVIADGRHDRMVMGSQGQLFIGSRNCTNINTSSEVRGCLTIVNTVASALTNADITVAPKNGDVTGIEAIANRNVVYVCEGGKLSIYDTTTDQPQTTQISIVGQAVDVKIADF
jgi:hypothetical protein